MKGSGQMWHLDETLDTGAIQRDNTQVEEGRGQVTCPRARETLKRSSEQVKKTELSASVEWCFGLFDFGRVIRIRPSYSISDQVQHIFVRLRSLNSFFGCNVCQMDVFATEGLVCEQHT